MSLENPDRPCAICGELVDTNDSERVVYLTPDEPAHTPCALDAVEEAESVIDPDRLEYEARVIAEVYGSRGLCVE